jgi:hypothetical protein
MQGIVLSSLDVCRVMQIREYSGHMFLERLEEQTTVNNH